MSKVWRYPRWLPFIGWRNIALDHEQAAAVDEIAGEFEAFELAWFGIGLTVAIKRLAPRVEKG